MVHAQASRQRQERVWYHVHEKPNGLEDVQPAAVTVSHVEGHTAHRAFVQGCEVTQEPLELPDGDAEQNGEGLELVVPALKSAAGTAKQGVMVL